MNNHQVTLGLINPKSASNVGAVMRAAGCYHVDSVFYTGERYDRTLRLNTDTKRISHTVPLTGVDSLLSVVPEQAQLVCVELAVGATPLPSYQHPESAMYVFGPEDGTISQTIIDQAEAVIYIPTRGCMNLAATVNVVLYDRLAKSALSRGSEAGDDLIRRSRDTNNRVRVRKASCDNRN